jgi:mitochondrial chaperone BCS1
VVGDLSSFLSKESFQFYNKHGIPYKRSYLFYGVPGAGKTSLLTAIAGKFKRNLCIMQPTDPRVTDDSLAEAIKEAPSRSIIVLEDVDALFGKNRDTKNPKMNISFSGLLNALDGVSNPDGQVFVLTTNFRENLDSALIRNGRVDLHVHFSHATAEQIETLFLQFYPEDTALAQPFREAVQAELGDKPVNMAALQHFFIRQMRTPAREVVAHVHTIVEDLNEKDAEASAEQDAKGAEKKEDDAGATAAAATCATAGAAVPVAPQSVVHVHVHAVAAAPVGAA